MSPWIVLTHTMVLCLLGKSASSIVLEHSEQAFPSAGSDERKVRSVHNLLRAPTNIASSSCSKPGCWDASTLDLVKMRGADRWQRRLQKDLPNAKKVLTKFLL